jgi:hypothetical protein
MIDLKKLEDKLDQALGNETSESLTEWIKEKRMKEKTAVEWQHIELSKFLHGKSEFTDAHDILIKAQEMEKEQHERLSASWAKSREQTRETAMHIGFAAGFECGLKCYEDFYQQLDKTDLSSSEFTRNYITDRFEETYNK